MRVSACARLVRSRPLLRALTCAVLVIVLSPNAASPPPAAAAAASEMVTVAYAGTMDAIFGYRAHPPSSPLLDETTTHEAWSMSWTGPLSVIENPALSLHLFFHMTSFEGTIRFKAFTTAEHNCYGTISLAPAAAKPPFFPIFDHYLGTLTVSAVMPDLANATSSSPDSNCSVGAFNNGEYGGQGPGGAGTAPTVKVSLLPGQGLGKGKTLTFHGSYRSSQEAAPEGHTISATFSVSSGALCSGTGGGEPPSHGCYVALGDSFSAGQMEPYVPGGESCYRSTSAYPVLYDPNVSFWACSGSTINNILLQANGAQIAHLQRQTKLVTLTIGGNDLGLFALLQLCALHGLLLSPCERQFGPAMSDARLQQRLVDLYETIHEHAPIARIFVLGYPDPLPASLPAGCKALSLPSPPHLGLPAADVPWFNHLIDRLNKTIAAATAESRVASYVAPDGFTGHDVCSDNPWFWPLSNSPVTLHPNFQGQRRMADLLRAAAGPPPG